MKKLLLLLPMLALTLRAQSPVYNNFPANHFTRVGNNLQVQTNDFAFNGLTIANSLTVKGDGLTMLNSSIKLANIDGDAGSFSLESDAVKFSTIAGVTKFQFDAPVTFGNNILMSGSSQVRNITSTDVPFVINGVFESDRLQEWRNDNVLIAYVDTAGFNGAGSLLTALNASALASGTVGTARLGSGTANSGSFLRGDQSWQPITIALFSGGPFTNAIDYGSFSISNAATASFIYGTNGNLALGPNGAGVLNGNIRLDGINGNITNGSTLVSSIGVLTSGQLFLRNGMISNGLAGTWITDLAGNRTNLFANNQTNNGIFQAPTVIASGNAIVGANETVNATLTVGSLTFGDGGGISNNGTFGITGNGVSTYINSNNITSGNHTNSGNLKTATFVTTGLSTMGNSLTLLTGDVTVPDGNSFRSAGRGDITWAGDGQIRLRNTGGTDFDRISFGGLTAAFTSLAKTNTGLAIMDATRTGFTNLTLRAEICYFYAAGTFPTNACPPSSASGTNFISLSIGGLYRHVFTNYAGAAGTFCQQLGSTVSVFIPP